MRREAERQMWFAGAWQRQEVGRRPVPGAGAPVDRAGLGKVRGGVYAAPVGRPGHPLRVLIEELFDPSVEEDAAGSEGGASASGRPHVPPFRRRRAFGEDARS